MKDFTISMYLNEKDLYKAKAEYYEDQFLKAKKLLKQVCSDMGNVSRVTTERVALFLSDGVIDE